MQINPKPLFFLLSFTTSLLFAMIFMVSSIYEATVANLQGYQLVLIGTALEVSILLFEIPTGVIADTRSRKLSVILGFFLIGLGFLIEGMAPAFLPILAAQVVAGLGFTFTSGATSAWLSDEIGESEANRSFLQANKFDQAGSLLGLGLATWIGQSNVALPLIVGSGSLMLFSLSLFGLMGETGFHPAKPEDRNTIQHAWTIFTDGLATIRGHRSLLTILGVGLVYGLYSEGWDRLWVKLILDRFDTVQQLGLSSVTFFGILRASGMLASMVISYFAEKRIDTGSAKAISTAFLSITAVLSVSIIVYSISPWISLLVAMFLTVSIMRSITGPLYTAWINQSLPSQSRATILSISGQVDAVGQVASGPLAAAISLVSVPAAIAFAGLLLTPALPLVRRVQSLTGQQP